MKALLLALALVVATTGFILTPHRDTDGISVKAVNGDVWVKYSITPIETVDSIEVKITASGTFSQKQMYRAVSWGATIVDSVQYVGSRPAPAGTISGTVTADSYRRGLKNVTSAQKPWSYTEPDIPPPTPNLFGVTAHP